MSDYEKALEEAKKRHDEIVNEYSRKLAFAVYNLHIQTTTYQLEKLTDLLQQTNELLERLIKLPVERALDFNLEDFQKRYRDISRERHEEDEQKP